MKYDPIAFWMIDMKVWAYSHPTKSSRGHQKPWFQLEFLPIFHCIIKMQLSIPK